MIKIHSTYTYEHYERDYDTDNFFLLPFDPDSDPQHVYIADNGLKAVLGFLVPDESPEDPFEAFDEGEFYQFDRGRAHDAQRPGLDAWKRIIRENPGRVVTVDAIGEYGFRAGHVVNPSDCRGKQGSKGDDCRAAELLEDMDGYYIAPEDATDAYEYAKSALQTYSAWCNGEVYGVCVWTYERASIADEWELVDRDGETWGFYGYNDYTKEELLNEFRYAIAGDDPSKEKEEAK